VHRGGGVTRKRVCIVTPAYLSSTPRVVKEADALSSGGFEVRVVFSQGDLDFVRAHDEALLAGRTWRTSVVRWARHHPAEHVTYWRATLRHQLARRAPTRLRSHRRLVEWAHERVSVELAQLAASEPADLYIGHYPAGLAAAAHAASVRRSRLGYDAEDFHAGENGDAQRKARIDRIERAHIGCCAHLTASSAQIAGAVAGHYGVGRPLTIHNTFPWADRAAIDGERRDRATDDLSLYWFSQTIGLDRGLQDAIKAVGLIDRPIQIHLRGSVSEANRTALLTLARQCRVAGRIHFHPLVPPSELLSRAAEHDIGLALEHPLDGNKALTGSNKLFIYLLAGLATLATDLPGQRAILTRAPGAAKLYTPGDHHALALLLSRWCSDPTALSAARAAALEAARTTWNWELESQALVESVQRALA
jgi:glycosyltransferase involved in cell wall biosynthesis